VKLGLSKAFCFSYEGEETASGGVFEDQINPISCEKITEKTHNVFEFEILMDQDFLLDIFDFLFEILHFDFYLVSFTILMAYFLPVFLEIPNRTDAKDPDPRLPPSLKMKSSRQLIFSSGSISFEVIM
jgi:hypothetical protein